MKKSTTKLLYSIFDINLHTPKIVPKIEFLKFSITLNIILNIHPKKMKINTYILLIKIFIKNIYTTNFKDRTRNRVEFVRWCPYFDSETLKVLH